MKKQIKVDDIVTINGTVWKVLEREGFTIGIVPADRIDQRTQYVDVSMVKKA